MTGERLSRGQQQRSICKRQRHLSRWTWAGSQSQKTLQKCNAQANQRSEQWSSGCFGYGCLWLLLRWMSRFIWCCFSRIGSTGDLTSGSWKGHCCMHVLEVGMILWWLMCRTGCNRKPFSFCLVSNHLHVVLPRGWFSFFCDTRRSLMVIWHEIHKVTSQDSV